MCYADLTYKSALKKQVSSKDFKTISNTWIDAFVEFHNINYKAAGLSKLGRPEGYVERQVSNWGKQYLAAATDEVPAAERFPRCWTGKCVHWETP